MISAATSARRSPGGNASTLLGGNGGRFGGGGGGGRDSFTISPAVGGNGGLPDAERCAQDRTAQVVHSALTWQFGTGAGGLPGNDDSGGLSSWYVWASLGLFPVAGQNLFLVNAPSFAESELRLGDGELRIETTGFVEPERDGPPQYVQSATFNGVPLDRTWLRGDDVHRGGRLRIELGPEPSAWGRDGRPPSASDP